MYKLIGKLVIGAILTMLALNYTELGVWSLLGLALPFVVGGD